MTRINVVPPSELCRQHLIAEIKEITRITTAARANTLIYGNARAWAAVKKPPASYKMGTGHVNFFIPRVQYIVERYTELCAEWIMRGYQVTEIRRDALLDGIDPSFMGGYIPTQEAISINRERIAARLAGMKGI